MPVIATYTHPDDAYLAVSKLAGSGVEAWLRDESTASLYWLYSDAIGGVKIEVADADVARAREILELPKEPSPLLRCPECGSENTHLRQMSLIAALALLCLNFILPSQRQTVRCLDCGKSFTLSTSTDAA